MARIAVRLARRADRREMIAGRSARGLRDTSGADRGVTSVALRARRVALRARRVVLHARRVVLRGRRVVLHARRERRSVVLPSGVTGADRSVMIADPGARSVRLARRVVLRATSVDRSAMRAAQTTALRSPTRRAESRVGSRDDFSLTLTAWGDR